MKNITDVLKQKETELQKIEREVEALRTALRLCAENEAEINAAESRLKMAAGSEASTPIRSSQGSRQFP